MRFKLPIPWMVIKMVVRLFVPEPYKTLLLGLIDYLEHLPDGPQKDELKGELAIAAMKMKSDGNLSHFKSVLEKCTGPECRVHGYDLK